jgi:glycosyltransferase involved in cell wall biosynthesis
LCAGYPGCKTKETIDGLKIIRHGRRLTVYIWAFFDYILKLRHRYDVVVDVENGIPFFSPFYVKKPTIIVVHHVHREQFFVEVGFPLNWIGYTLETKVMPVAYRHYLYVAVSHSTREDLIELGIAPHRITIVHNGLDHEACLPFAGKAPTPTILYLGRLKQYKRIDLLLRVMPQILRTYPNASLWIVGQGDARPKLEQLARQLEILPHVKFLGFVDEREKVRLLQQAWVFVNPSMIEGWGLSTLEANACGTPSVVFDVPGLRDAVLDERTGFVVPEGDLDGLFQKISVLLGDAQLRERQQRNAVDWSRRFNWDESARSMLALLEGVCKDGQPQKRSCETGKIVGNYHRTDH